MASLRQSIFNSLTVYIFLVWGLISLPLLWSMEVQLFAKILFAPFLLDISKGVGDASALYFRWISSVTLITMALFVVLRIRANKKSLKNLFSLLGIFATTIHYGLVAVGYITTGLH